MTRDQLIVQAAEALVAIRSERDKVDQSFRHFQDGPVDPARRVEWERMMIVYTLKHIKAEDALKAAVQGDR